LWYKEARKKGQQMKIFDDQLTSLVLEQSNVFSMTPDDARLVHFGRTCTSEDATNEIATIGGFRCANAGELWDWYKIITLEERKQYGLIVALGTTVTWKDMDRVPVIRPDRPKNEGMLMTSFKSVIWAADVRFLAIDQLAMGKRVVRALPETKAA